MQRRGRLLRARPAVPRTAQTMIGDIEVQRAFVYCHYCHRGRYPLDESLGLSAGRMQLDVQQAAVDLATELPLRRLRRCWPSQLELPSAVSACPQSDGRGPQRGGGGPLS